MEVSLIFSRDVWLSACIVSKSFWAVSDGSALRDTGISPRARGFTFISGRGLCCIHPFRSAEEKKRDRECLNRAWVEGERPPKLWGCCGLLVFLNRRSGSEA